MLFPIEPTSMLRANRLLFVASCCLAWMCCNFATSQSLHAQSLPPANSEPRGLGAPGSAGGITPDQTPDPQSGIEEALRIGKALEQEKRWQEAIQHYEKALKKTPANKSITERLQISRVHMDVARRYADRTFIESVERSTPAQSLEVYHDVLSKLETYYVDPIDHYKLALYGTAFLEVALTEKDFLQRQLPRTPAATIENFRRNVHRSVFGRRIGSIEELKNLVLYIANQAEQQIGLQIGRAHV